MIVLNLCTGFLLVIAHVVMANIPDTKQLDASLVHLYRLLPPYVFGEALLNLTNMCR